MAARSPNSCASLAGGRTKAGQANRRRCEQGYTTNFIGLLIVTNYLDVVAEMTVTDLNAVEPEKFYRIQISLP